MTNHCGHECVCGRFQQTACVHNAPCPAGSDIYEPCEHETRTRPASAPDADILDIATEWLFQQFKKHNNEAYTFGDNEMVDFLIERIGYLRTDAGKEEIHNHQNRQGR